MNLKYSFQCLVQIADKGRLRVMLFIEMGKENVQIASVPKAQFEKHEKTPSLARAHPAFAATTIQKISDCNARAKGHICNTWVGY